MKWWKHPKGWTSWEIVRACWKARPERERGELFINIISYTGVKKDIRLNNKMEVKRTYETRRVRFRWRVRERVWCWSRSDRVGPLVQTSPRPLTRTPDRVRSGTKTPSRMPNRVRSGTKTPSKLPHKYWGGLDFRGLFIFWLFSVLHVSLFFSSIMPIAVLVSSLQKAESL